MHTSYPLVLKFELEREVVFRPAFVLPLGCPDYPLKWILRKLNPNGGRQVIYMYIRRDFLFVIMELELSFCN